MGSLASVDDVKARLTDLDEVEKSRILTVLEEVSALFCHEARRDFADKVPDVVRYRVASITAKILMITPEARAGINSVTSTSGPLTETVSYAGWSLGGQVSLSPDDVRFARSFRRVGQRLFVSAP